MEEQAIKEKNITNLANLINLEDYQIYKVEVVNPKLKESKIGTYTVFTVKGQDTEGDFQVERRYNDFALFREALIQRWPGCYIPPIPEKQIFGKGEESFIQDRQLFLTYFCKKLADIKYLFYSDEGRLFFKSSGENFEGLLKQLPVMDFSQIVSQYKHTFSFLSGKEINTELILKINAFKGYLEKQQKSHLQGMSKFTQTLQETQSQFNEMFNNFNTSIMPEYEKNCMKNFVEDQEILLYNNNPAVQEPAEQIKKMTKHFGSYSYFNEFVKYEQKECGAFMDAFNCKENLDIKKEKLQTKIKEQQQEIAGLLSNKTSLKSIFKGGSKEEKIQKIEAQLKKQEEELQLLQTLIDLITLILGYVEIDKFKQTKSNKYYEIIQLVSEIETQYHQQTLQIWQQINSGKRQVQVESTNLDENI